MREAAPEKDHSSVAEPPRGILRRESVNRGRGFEQLAAV